MSSRAKKCASPYQPRIYSSRFRSACLTTVGAVYDRAVIDHATVLPGRPHRISRNARIGCQKDHPVNDRLRNENAVEGIIVEVWESKYMQGRLLLQWQDMRAEFQSMLREKVMRTVG